ncbi:hypothetical protein JCM6882_004766 [Rhodosporidiobolus microsporus]
MDSATRRPPRLRALCVAVVLPVTVAAVGAWTGLLASCLLPFVGVVSLPSLVVCTALLVYLIPLTLHLLFSQPHTPNPPLFPLLPSFSLSKSARLTFHALRLFYDAWRARLPLLVLDGLAKRVLLLGGKGAEKLVKENLVYIEACPPLYPQAKRLDVYFPPSSSAVDSTHSSTTGADSPSAPLAPIVLLLPSPTYRLLPSLKSFPSAHIALRLARLGALVVVPSLTAYGGGMEDGECVERMVAEVREAIKWVGRNGERYGGDVDRVWVVGYGAGAHVGLLTVVQSVVVSARDAHLARRAEADERRKAKEGRVSMDDGSGREGPPALDKEDDHSDSDSSVLSDGASFFSRTSERTPRKRRQAAFGHDDGVDDVPPVNIPAGILSAQLWTLDSLLSRSSSLPSPSLPSSPASARQHEPEHRAESIPSFTLENGRGRRGGQEKRLRVRGMVLVGGVYDVVQQMKAEEKVGMGDVSSLRRACASPTRDILQACPSHLLYASLPLLSLLSSTANTTKLAHLLPTRFLLIHGGADPSVPFSQAVLFRNLLVGAGVGAEGEKGGGKGKGGDEEAVRLRLYKGESGMGALASLMSHTKYSPLVLHELEEAIFRDEGHGGAGGGGSKSRRK